jgi:hypothetical protein
MNKGGVEAAAHVDSLAAFWPALQVGQGCSNGEGLGACAGGWIRVGGGGAWGWEGGGKREHVDSLAAFWPALQVS